MRTLERLYTLPGTNEWVIIRLWYKSENLDDDTEAVSMERRVLLTLEGFGVKPDLVKIANSAVKLSAVLNALSQLPGCNAVEGRWLGKHSLLIYPDWP